jgi:hypothetical protein
LRLAGDLQNWPAKASKILQCSLLHRGNTNKASEDISASENLASEDISASENLAR